MSNIEIIEKLCLIIEQAISMIEDEQSAKAMEDAFKEAIGDAGIS